MKRRNENYIYTVLWFILVLVTDCSVQAAQTGTTTYSFSENPVMVEKFAAFPHDSHTSPGSVLGSECYFYPVV